MTEGHQIYTNSKLCAERQRDNYKLCAERQGQSIGCVLREISIDDLLAVYWDIEGPSICCVLREMGIV